MSHHDKTQLLIVVSRRKDAALILSFTSGLPYSFQTILTADIAEAAPRRVDGAFLVMRDASIPAAEQLAALRRLSGDAPVIVVTEPGQTQLPMEAIAAGARDFLYLPLTAERVDVSLRNAMRSNGATPPPVYDTRFGEFVGTSDALMSLLLKARAMALPGGHLLFYGERGVGKTMLARAMHRGGPHQARPLHLHNVRQSGEIPLILREASPESSLCLNFDEPSPADMMTPAAAAQAAALAAEKKLQLILCQRMPRMAEKAHLPELPLPQALAARALFLPPLRSRPEDTRAQCDYFLSRNALSMQRPPLVPTAAAYRLLAQHDWAGNTRQLMHVLYQACLFADGARLGAIQLEELLDGDRAPARMTARDFAILPFDGSGQVKRLGDIEAELMTLAFRHYQGSRSEVARRLGIGRTTLYRKMRQIGLA